MASIKQNPDGSLSIVSDLEGIDVMRAGGPAVASAAAPNFRPGTIVKWQINGPTDTAGALGSWQNNLGYAIIVIGIALDVTTQSAGACTVSIGGAANGTTLNATLISGQSVAATGTFTKATPPVQRVAAGAFITASTASGASSGLVGNVYVEYIPA
jgi:hypothetical protein